jgi:hypothetical protein
MLQKDIRIPGSIRFVYYKKPLSTDYQRVGTLDLNLRDASGCERTGKKIGLG